MAYSQGFSSGTDVPIEHLDYNYISECTSSSYLEKILKILRSNKEGSYPGLMQFAEDRLTELNPKSKLLIKNLPAKELRDLPLKDYQDLNDEMQQWEDKIRGEESELKKSTLNSDLTTLMLNSEDDCEKLPPVRQGGAILKDRTVAGEGGGRDEGEERIKSVDYKAWEKFDVDAECAKVELGSGKNPKNSGAPREVTTPVQDKVYHRDRNMSEVERQKLALREKEKGNEAFKSGDYSEALSYYCRSLQLHSTAHTHNNRAITFIRLEQYQEALQDCDSVLQMEPGNIKAMLRRGTALVSLKKWEEAVVTLEQLLAVQPSNTRAQQLLAQARSGWSQSEVGSDRRNEKTRKGHKVLIEEEMIDGPRHSKNIPPPTPSVTTPPLKSKETTPPGTMPTTITPHKTTSSKTKTAAMPTNVCDLKEKGNILFRRGQYGEAVLAYSEAVEALKEVCTGSKHDASMATLLNNRAACQLKNGNPSKCVADCTDSLTLSPINIKALVRRAQAYEQLDRYRLAYVDNHLALSLDRSMQMVYAANTRITKLLQDQDGLEWRSKLPVHSHQYIFTEALKHQAALHSSPPHQDNLNAAGREMERREHASSSTSVTPPTSSTPPLLTCPITTSSLNNAQTQVTQSTQSIMTSIPTQATTVPLQPSDNMDIFEKEKAKGNAHIQKSQYVEALHCYSSCIAARPDQVAGYTNRALCHLKLSSLAKAESDCSQALQLDPTNVKALYRRALARKSMDKYAESAKDLKQLLSVDQSNSVARAELEEVKKLWEKKLRLLQADSQQQKVKIGEGEKRRNTRKGHLGGVEKDKERKKEGGVKGKGISQREELEQLLAMTKNKMMEMEKVSSKLASATTTAATAKKGAETGTQPSSSSSDCLQASTTTYNKQQHGSNSNNNNPDNTEPNKNNPGNTESNKNNPGNTESNKNYPGNTESTSSGKTIRRRKVVIEEGEGDEEACRPPQKSLAGKHPQEPTAGQPPLLQTNTEKENIVEQTQGEVQTEKVLEDKTDMVMETQVEETVERGGRTKDVKASKLQCYTPYEFMQQWSYLPHEQTQSSASVYHASVLCQLSPRKLPDLITNKLDGHMLSSILAAVSTQFMPHKHYYQLSIDILVNLSKVPRFQIVVMFLKKREKMDLKCMLGTLRDAGAIPVKTLEDLKKIYGLL